jgi:hypothetical protein
MFPSSFLFALCRPHEGQRHVLADPADVQVVFESTLAALVAKEPFRVLVGDMHPDLLAVYELLHIPP